MWAGRFQRIGSQKGRDEAKRAGIKRRPLGWIKGFASPFAKSYEGRASLHPCSAKAVKKPKADSKEHYLVYDLSHTAPFDDAWCNCGKPWPCSSLEIEGKVRACATRIADNWWNKSSIAARDAAEREILALLRDLGQERSK